VYERIIARAKKRGHCIVVVSEGAEEGMIEEEKEEMRKQLKAEEG